MRAKRFLTCICLLALSAPLALASYNFNWNTPSSVGAGTQYTVLVQVYYAGPAAGYTGYITRSGNHIYGWGGPAYTWTTASVPQNDANPGTATFIAEATSYYGEYGSSSYSVTITGNPPTVNAISASCTYNSSTSFNASGSSVTTWSASGLPSGLSISSTTGTISGTPTAVPNTYTATITGTNSSGSASNTATITVNKANFNPPNAPSNATINAGSAWAPGITGGNAISGTIFCVAGPTNWQQSAWTPDSGNGGHTYSYYVANLAPVAYYNGPTDPNWPGYAFAISGPASVTVNAVITPASFTLSGGPFTYDGMTKSVSVVATPANATYTVSGSLSGTNAQTYSVTVTATGNYSGSSNLSWTINKASASFGLSGGPFTYDGASKSVGVVSNPSGATYTVTSGSLSGSNAGTYGVTITANGNYAGSSSGSWTINPAPVSFSFSGGPNFSYDGTTKSISVNRSPGGATYSTSGTYSASAPGTYTAYASGTGNYSGSGSYTWSIGKSPQNPAVSISPTSQTITAGGSVSFTAGGGSGTGGWSWSGATGSGTSATATFNTAGTYSVSVTHGADGNYNASTATATITVNPAVPIITSGTTANGTVGSSFTYQITASNSPTSYAATNLAGTGLSINTSTGLISGTPTSVGTITSSLSAANGGGTSTPVTLTIAVGAAPPQADDNTHNQLNIHLPN